MINEYRMSLYVEQACRLRLNGWELLAKHTPSELVKMANGIGPSYFSDKLSSFINNLNPTLILPCIIHDIRYIYGNGNYGDFLQANSDLEINCRLCIDDKYKHWYNLQKYWLYYQSSKFKSLCDDFGYKAYVLAIEEKHKYIK